ncbi:hypothetical protein [Aestuariibius sp. HNIBRBA575]|uniref:hypothetical protein n=1 Tax=Aestuariibius sp. HNIBRBA575 TaxID=3233343 RepID=UPI0034A5451A
MMPIVHHIAQLGLRVITGGLRAMDIALHLGAHRTGTTTFQSYLRANADGLQRAGITAWTPKRTRHGFFNGLIRNARNEQFSAISESIRSTGLIRIELERMERRQMRFLIVSEENMIGSMHSNIRAGALYPNLSVRLERFLPAFEDRCVRIGLAIRSLDAYWASTYAYAVEMGRPWPTPSDLDRVVTHPRTWRDVIQDAAAVLPNVQFRVWAAERFISQPDVQLGIMTGAQKVSRSSGARQWHNRGPRLAQLRDIASMTADPQIQANLPDGDGRWMPFDSNQQHALREKYQEDVAWLRNGADGLATFIEDTKTQPMSGDTGWKNNSDSVENFYGSPERGHSDGKRQEMG